MESVSTGMGAEGREAYGGYRRDHDGARDSEDLFVRLQLARTRSRGGGGGGAALGAERRIAFECGPALLAAIRIRLRLRLAENGKVVRAVRMRASRAASFFSLLWVVTLNATFA